MHKENPVQQVPMSDQMAYVEQTVTADCLENEDNLVPWELLDDKDPLDHLD